MHERSERLGFEARAASKRAIQFFLRHQPLNVVRLYAAAIENPQCAGMTGGKALRRTLAENAVGGRCDFRGCRAARADGPNGVVGNQNTGGLLEGQSARASEKLR